MVRLFPKKGSVENPENPAKKKVTDFWVKTLQKRQMRLAGILSNYERQLPIRQKKMLLLIFCIGMSGLSACWIYEGLFSTTTDKPDFLQHQSITVPQKTLLPDSLDIRYLQQYKRWRETQDSLHDSLKK
jgi:hypothetical protein